MNHAPALRRANVALALTCLIYAASSYAQDDASPVEDSTAEPENGQSWSGQIEEIVVTAQHRTERLQDVPIAISAASAEQMKAQGIDNAFDIGKMTPSFSTARVVGFGTPFMRGVGSTNVGAGDEPGVATYIDGFYQGLGIAAQLPFNNVERVEVLKGPQGTLYGRNAVGGLISIVTRMPQHEFAFDGSAGYANYDTYSGNAYVTGGLSDKIAMDLSVTAQDQGKGYNKNLLNGKHYGTNDYVAVRSKLLIDLNDSDSLVIGLEYADSKNNLANVNSVAPGTTPLLAGPGVIYGDSPFEFAANIDPRFDVEQYGVNAKLTLGFNFADFVSLTQYRKLVNHNAVEGDGTSADGVLIAEQQGPDPDAPPDVVPLATLSYTDKQKIPFFTQEFQLISNTPGAMKWIMGAFIQSSKDSYDPLDLSYDTTMPPAAVYNVWQSTLALAAFAQGTYTLENGISLTAGARYSAERKRVGGDFTGKDPDVGEQQEWFRSPTFRLAADYHFSDAMMVYATFNKGFKSGILNAQVPTNPPVDPEKLYAYEIGFKASPTSYFRADASVYYYDYRDIQTFLTDGETGLTLLQNAGSAEMYGAELSMELNPHPSVLLRSAIGVEKATYQKFDNSEGYLPSSSGGNYQVSRDVSGNDVIRTPAVTANLSGSYYFDVSSGWSGALNASVAYSDSFYWDTLNVAQQKAYTLVDLSAKFTTVDDHWSLTFWGKNVTDEEYLVYRNQQQRYDAVAWGDPATYGVTVGYTY